MAIWGSRWSSSTVTYQDSLQESLDGASAIVSCAHAADSETVKPDPNRTTLAGPENSAGSAKSSSPLAVAALRG